VDWAGTMMNALGFGGGEGEGRQPTQAPQQVNALGDPCKALCAQNPRSMECVQCKGGATGDAQAQLKQMEAGQAMDQQELRDFSSAGGVLPAPALAHGAQFAEEDGNYVNLTGRPTVRGEVYGRSGYNTTRQLPATRAPAQTRTTPKGKY